ncbi:MAG: DUF881 domain-containing protein [Oscillospiraceae bacterium]|nr:DUF881 domain-containing protein [Oscillospiraceae bacterium]MDD4368329.1 DUF881 domain-containing protein [Oscillospiraceae bacterium]
MFRLYKWWRPRRRAVSEPPLRPETAEQRQQRERRSQRAFKYLLAALLLLLSAVLVNRFHTLRAQVQDAADVLAPLTELQTQLQQEQDQYQSLLNEAQELARQEASLQDQFLANQDLLQEADQDLGQQLAFSRVMAGTVEVKGAGVTLTLSDAEGIDYSTATAADIIHDQDVANAVNALKILGAQAIAVNGERLTATSRLICNGPTILVNRTKLAAPFVITATGDQAVLLAGLNENPRLKELKAGGKTVKIEASAELVIPAFNDQALIDEAVNSLKVRTE